MCPIHIMTATLPVFLLMVTGFCQKPLSKYPLQVMLADIVACGQLGAHGVALGCLKVDGQVDEAKSGVLVQAAIQQVCISVLLSVLLMLMNAL